jgi:glycosyltransferase involved in cell wall biosynthesis
VRPLRRTIEVGRDGATLLPGITAVVAARDEEYTIRFCLRSLLGFADQIVCIDNGSADSTLREMEVFRDEHGDELDVEVVSLPGALLGGCREEGLRRTRRRWHLRWDADMVAKTSGPESMLDLRERVLADDRPRTIQLPRTNLIGDLRHTQRLSPVVDPGEPILMHFGRGVSYREFGRFDAVRIPLHYLQRREPGRHYFHLAGLKSDDNLIHRFHYFAWRELVNREGAALDPELRTLDGYKRRMNLELFGTNEPRSLKFRYRRQLCYHLTPFNPEEHGDYPDVLREELSRPQRFEVVYQDGKPWTRVDHEDAEMLDYEPTAADFGWDPETFLRRLLSEEECRRLGIQSSPAEDT